MLDVQFQMVGHGAAGWFRTGSSNFAGRCWHVSPQSFLQVSAPLGARDRGSDGGTRGGLEVADYTTSLSELIKAPGLWMHQLYAPSLRLHVPSGPTR